MENQTLKEFISFPGAGKNGHTLIASLLDTHPQVVIANSYYENITEEMIMELAKDPKKWAYGAKHNFTNIGQNEWTDIKYLGVTAFSKTSLGYNPIYINVYRDPYKLIESRSIKLKNRKLDPRKAAIDSYEDSLKEMREHPGINISFEQFIHNPIEGMKVLFGILRLEFTTEYLKTITGIVI